MKIVTFGEIMVRLGAPSPLRLSQCNQLDLSFAGAEANVAVSLANYGMDVEYITRLPKSVCSQMMQKFPNCKKMVVTLRGAINANHNTWRGVLFDGKNLLQSKQYDITNIVDRVCGGDSFMGGLIYRLLTYPADDQKALEFAVAASALKHTIFGDFNRVSVDEVKALMEGNTSGRVKR